MRGLAFVVRKSAIQCITIGLAFFMAIHCAASPSLCALWLSHSLACSSTKMRKMYLQPVDTVNSLVDKSYELICCTKRYCEHKPLITDNVIKSTVASALLRKRVQSNPIDEFAFDCPLSCVCPLLLVFF